MLKQATLFEVGQLVSLREDLPITHRDIIRGIEGRVFEILAIVDRRGKCEYCEKRLQANPTICTSSNNSGISPRFCRESPCPQRLMLEDIEVPGSVFNIRPEVGEGELWMPNGFYFRCVSPTHTSVAAE